MRLKPANVFTVARWEFFKGAKSPMFLVMTILIPVLMAVGGLAGFLTERANQEMTMNLAFMASEELAPAISHFFQDSHVTLTHHQGVEDEIKAAVEKGTYDGYFVLDEMGLSTGRVPLYTTDARKIHSGILRQLLTTPVTAYRLEQLGYDTHLVSAAVAPILVDTRVIKDGVEEEFSFIAHIMAAIAGVVFIMAVMMSGQVLMYGVIKEKRNRVVEILLSSVSSLDLLVGKLIGFGVLTILQIAIWVTGGLLVANFLMDLGEITFSLVELIPAAIFAFFGYFLLAAMFAALGSTMKDAEEGSHAQGLVVLIPIAPLMVVGLLESAPNAIWARVASHLPPFIPSMMLLRMAMTQIAIWEMVSAFVALILSTLLFIYLGARIFEGGILQYERTVGLKDLGRMIRKSK